MVWNTLKRPSFLIMCIDSIAVVPLYLSIIKPYWAIILIFWNNFETAAANSILLSKKTP